MRVRFMRKGIVFEYMKERVKLPKITKYRPGPKPARPNTWNWPNVLENLGEK